MKINMAAGPRPSLPPMKAADIMMKEVITVGPETPVRDVALLMLKQRISGVPVVDAERRVLGVVSEGDLIRRPEIETDHPPAGWLSIFLSDDDRSRDYVKSHGRRAREVMTQPAICATPGTPLAEIVRIMERHRIKRLVIAEQGRLAGVVTRADLLRAMVAEHPAPTGPASSDRELRACIEQVLRAQDWAASAVVNVTVEKGVAQLWGTVESAAQRQAFIVAVQGVPGVRDVEAHLGRTMPG